MSPHGTAPERSRRGPLAVFCDFDGTFSVQDVGASLARRLRAELRPVLWARFERGEITAWDYNLTLLDRLELPRHELDAFLESIELDPGAVPLLHWCREREVPFRILSDGFDYNLDRLQEIHGVRFAHDSNRLRYEGDTWRIESGHPNPACGCGTGTCKRGRIDAYRAERGPATVAHIGNGWVSDLCGALAADVVFAKSSLAEALGQRGVDYFPFETLSDVIPRLAELAGEGRP